MNLDSIKSKLVALQKQGQKGEKKEKVDFSKFIWKPKEEGKYQIRIVPSKLDKDNPFKEVFLHYGIGKFPIYALTNWGESDPIVEFSKKLQEKGDKESWKLGKKLEPKMRVFAPVIVRGEEDKGVRLWEFGKETYMNLLGIAEDEDYGDYTNISEGRDFTLEAVLGDVGGRKGLKSTLRIKPKTSPLSTNKKEVELWLDEQPDILEIQSTYKKSYESLKETLKKFLEPEGENQESENENQTNGTDDLPWDENDKDKKQNYSVKNPKISKADKFGKLFEDKN